MNVPFYIAGSYLLGSIPTGYWLGKVWKGMDVRQHGSGNLGATNVFRVLGKGPGIVTLLFDIAKGALPVVAAKHCPGAPALLPLWAGLAAIVGHTTSIFVRLRGGKGVATSAGVFAALAPTAFGISLLVFLLVFARTRIVSLSSILSAVTLAAMAWLLTPHTYMAWMAAGIAVFVLWTHRANIDRLRKGTEHRIGMGKKV